jgi:NAD(P)-dependent dehydrogenase (short-subunit alcohol dehydrogenase family)
MGSLTALYVVGFNFMNLDLFVGVTVNSLHPGAVVTDLFRHFGPVVSTIIKFLLQLFHKVR